MTTSRNILVFMGTRPEAVKLAPVVAELRGTSDCRCTVVATGQHKEMFQQVAETFGFTVDADLDVMRPNQSLASLTARLMDGIDGWLGSAKPDLALVQVLVMRDTTERPEGVAAGTALLTGPRAAAIVEHASRLLGDEAAYRAMASARNPYGDGHAAKRIVDRIRRHFAG